jgi:hypothetical protein
MLTLLKWVFIAALVLIGGMWILGNYSQIPSRYECNGTYESNDAKTTKGKLFLRINLYRFYVHLWSDSDGNYFMEDMRGTLSYGNKLRDDGTTAIYLTNNDGMLSKTSGNLWIKTSMGLFEGNCSRMQNL